MPDLIRVSDLEIVTVIGVGDAERTKPQTLLISLDLRVKDIGPAAYTDNVNLTVDYSAVAERVKIMAASRPRHLIETLAEEIAADLLKAFPLVSIRLELRKFFALPGAHHVSVVIERPIDRSTERPAPIAPARPPACGWRAIPVRDGEVIPPAGASLTRDI
jgi:dihydroneopterin aldolase